jgi:hypothetical protein
MLVLGGGVAVAPQAFAADTAGPVPAVAAAAKDKDCKDHGSAEHKLRPTDSNIRYAIRPERNNVIFWTGRNSRPGQPDLSMEDVAFRLAQHDGGATLEMMLNNINMPDFSNRCPRAHRVWTLASQLLARRARGVVRVVRGQNTRPNNIWESEEFPAIRENPNVLMVVEYRPQDNGTYDRRVIYTRTEGDGGNDARRDGPRGDAARACLEWAQHDFPDTNAHTHNVVLANEHMAGGERNHTQQGPLAGGNSYSYVHDYNRIPDAGASEQQRHENVQDGHFEITGEARRVLDMVLGPAGNDVDPDHGRVNATRDNIARIVNSNGRIRVVAHHGVNIGQGDCG